MSSQLEFGPNNSALNAIFGPALMARKEKWCTAYRITLVNAGMFIIIALAMLVLKPQSLVVILSAPALFFLGCMLSFLLMVRSGGDLAAISWFVLGSGIYFGMGAVAGGLHVHPHSDYLFADDTGYLLRVNLLNACSVFVVLIAAYPLANMRGLKVSECDLSHKNVEGILRKIFPYVVAISTIGVGMKYALFPVSEGLLLRSMAAKIYIIIPSCFFLLGLLWRSSGWYLRLIASSVLLLEMLNGLIALTKYQIIIAMLALLIGLAMWRRSVVFSIMSFIVIASVFVVINPLITLGRSHVDYDADKNTVANRLEILIDAVNTFYLESVNSEKFKSVNSEKFKSVNSEKFTQDIEGLSANKARLRALGRRFDVASIQGYLINEYDNGHAGKSLDDFWAVMIPRVLWPEKPVVTRFGKELHTQFSYEPGESVSQTSSSAAPSYSGEAYWNYGVKGVVIVSILLGIAIGWLTRGYQRSMLGRDPAFFLIAFPAAIWASSVESWVVGTYLGEFIIFMVIYISMRVIFASFRSLDYRVRT